jgi:hypothetical protein
MRTETQGMIAKYRSLLTALLILARCPLSIGSEIAFPEHGFSLNLPGDWLIEDQEAVEEMNAELRKDARTASTQYYRMIVPSEDVDHDKFPTYILVQVTDQSIPPDKFAEMFPSFVRGAEKAVKLLEDFTEVHILPDEAAYDPQTRTGLLPHRGTDPEGIKYRGVSVILPTETKIISLHVYADDSAADEVFAKVVPALQSASIQREVAMSDEWNAAIEKLLKRGKSERN